MTRLPVVTVVLLVLLSFSCERKAARCSARDLGRVFEGFIYVGSFQVAPGHGIPVHGYDPVPLPEAFVPGQRYVFHHVGPLDSSRFGIHELPRRLAAAGMSILHAPRSEADLVQGEPTGLGWWVDFEGGGCKGRIHNPLDPVLYERGGLSPRGSIEAFVLTINPDR